METHMNRSEVAPVVKRNYALTGPEGKRAAEKGLVSASWYKPSISRQRLKELMQRRDGPAIRDTLIWFGALGLSGWLGFHFWGTWWAVPAFLVYGVIWGSSADSRWHECGHGTAFKTAWMNNVVYHIASFMLLREGVAWRFSHSRHHTDTIIVGRDREIQVPRPPDIAGILLNLFDLKTVPIALKGLIINCFGKLTAEEADFVPVSETWKAILAARIYLLIVGGFIAWAIAIHSWLPVMYVGLPTLYGAWLKSVYALTQHAGMAEDVLDHRLNTRTVYMNRLNRFLYWNMNYHIEHHIFPTVPYYSLPALHQEVKAEMPRPYKGLIEAYREIIPALLHQVREPGWYVKRELPLQRAMTA
jgi:fatty acid desaturase